MIILGMILCIIGAAIAEQAIQLAPGTSRGVLQCVHHTQTLSKSGEQCQRAGLPASPAEHDQVYDHMECTE